MSCYRALSNQIFSSGDFSIVPVRMEDRYLIMRWRNEQIYHLRQDKELTKDDQDKYFEQVVFKLFKQNKPDQILFSFLKKNQCIGYGGLVHINWIDHNAEISFIMDTSHESTSFDFHWRIFLYLIEIVAFSELNLHKLYIYAFDLRQNLYKVLTDNNYFKDAQLKEHCFYINKYIDVIIHSKIKETAEWK